MSRYNDPFRGTPMAERVEHLPNRAEAKASAGLSAKPARERLFVVRDACAMEIDRNMGRKS